jgi:hypothetical protein
VYEKQNIMQPLQNGILQPLSTRRVSCCSGMVDVPAALAWWTRCSGMVDARNGESSRTVSEAAIRRASRTVSEAAIRRAMLIALCLLPAAGSSPAPGQSAMGVNEHGAYDFRARARQMPPPIPMPPRSFFEVASLRVRLRSNVHFLVCCGTYS